MSPPPTAEQAAAIAATAREVLLRAGAGSGKTTVLVDRYCELIARQQLSPDQILAFTFTRKAAAQLRERIRLALLGRAAQEGDGEVAARLADAAARIGSAWVMTIHGFCQAVISAHPVAAGIDPNFTVIEDLSLEKLRSLAFDRALERFLADPATSEAREGTVAAYGIARLRQLLLTAYDELRSHGMSAPTLPEPERTDPLALLDRLAEACSTLLDAADYRPDKRNHEKIVNLLTISSRGREWLGGRPPDAGPAALLAALEANRFGSAVNGRAEISELARKACGLLYEELAGVDCHRHISELLSLYGTEFSAAKAARSALDFDDLQLLATRLLRDNAAIGEAYRGRFRQIMVDEFQDTSPLQVALIETLIGPETAIFQVGDKFQAIYGFRHADLANFDRVDRRLRSDPEAEVLQLSGNFRSAAAVLSAVNELAAGLLPGFPPLRVGGDAQAGEPRGGGSSVELILTAAGGWDAADPAPVAPEGVSLKRAAEAEALAHRLDQLVRAGVPRGEIVVLLRALSQAGTYAAALERFGLRPFVVGGRGFWQGGEVIDAVALLRAIANPLDEEALFGALSGPACAASPDTLWLLRRAAGRGPVWEAVKDLVSPDRNEWLAEIDASDRESIERLHSELVYLRHQRAMLSLAELVELALTRTGLDLAAAGGGRGAAGLAALRKLSRLAAEYEATEGRDLRGFLDHVQMQAERGEEAEAPTAAEGHDGVRIMTIHAAKGLEFPVVAVPELARPFGGGDFTRPSLRLARRDNGGWLLGLELPRIGAETVKLFDWDEIDEQTKAEQAEEELRLFYVAMTRAKERLILSGQAVPAPKQGISHSTPLMPRLLGLLGIDVETDGPPPSPPPLIFPPAEPREELDLKFAPTEMQLLVNWPEPKHRLALSSLQSDESAGAGFAGDLEVRERIVTAGAEAGPATAQLEFRFGESLTAAAIKPLPDPPPPLPPLSFSALSDMGYGSQEGSCALPAGPQDADGRATSSARRASDELGLDAAGRAYGLAIHALLERALTPGAAGARWRPITDAMIAREMAHHGLSEAALPRARRQIDNWLGSALCDEISRPGVGLRAETPLLLRLDVGGGATLRGWIDLLAEPAPGGALVIDYKTNRLDGRRPEEAATGYRLQAEIYALAVSRALAVARVEVAFAFLDAADEPVRIGFGPDDLAVAEAHLVERIDSLRSAPESGRAAEANLEARRGTALEGSAPG